MSSVRLLVSMIIDGKFHVRGSIVDDGPIPGHLRDAAHVAYDLENRQGRVLVLRDLSFHSIPRSGPDGIPVSYPVHVMAGELLELARVPASQRQSLVEGTDYRSQWTNEDQEQVRKAADEVYLKGHEAEPEVPAWMMNR